MYSFIKECNIRHHFLTGKGTNFKVYRGQQTLESGYIFAPYIPIQTTQRVYESNNFQPRESIMTRYARRVVNNSFYGTIRVDGL
jgi:hypothetical protein